MMRAILIDPFTQTIEEVDYSGDYKDIYSLIECDLFTTVYLPNTSDDTLFVDDEGLYVENQRFFKIDGFEQPLAGRGLLLGTDEGRREHRLHVYSRRSKGHCVMGKGRHTSGGQLCGHGFQPDEGRNGCR
jgi:hypothetical protein